jgi:hypothetical protein
MKSDQLATEILEAIGIDPGTVTRVCLIFEVGRVATINVTHTIDRLDGDFGHVVKRYEIVEQPS